MIRKVKVRTNPFVSDSDYSHPNRNDREVPL